MVPTCKVAAVQATPVFLDREATIARVRELTAAAAAEGASLVVLPEAFVPGFPEWVWRTKPWDAEATALYAVLVDQAVVIPGAAADELGLIAAEHGVHLAVGVNEIEPGGGTLYNSLLVFGPDGTLLHRHRKLVLTGPERLIWGQGEHADLTTVETPFGRIGGLICWESYMPLARAALYAEGVDIYLAPTWDDSEEWLATMRHIAREGRVWVISVNMLLHAGDVGPLVPGRDLLYPDPDDWMSQGNAAIFDPDGAIVAGPLRGEAGMLIAEIDPTRTQRSRMQFDPVGHYARPDLFRLETSGGRQAGRSEG